MISTSDTICAIASPAGSAARGIVRLSGPETLSVVARCVVSPEGAALAMPAGPAALPAVLRLPAPLGDLPGTLFVWPGTRSYTRQPTVEFHTLGAPVLLAAAVQEFCRQGARPAEPGEFTLRAFLAGRIDLTQAEAVLGVIDAAGEQPLRKALEQLSGGLSRPLAALREQLLQLLAHLEAGLDFVEEDIEFISRAEIEQSVSAAVGQVEALVEQLQDRRFAGEYTTVVFMGLPNVGKSSLFNALVGSEGALVSDQSGTTRDYLTAEVSWQGVPLKLVDTAGVSTEPGAGTLDQVAQAISHEQQQSATLRLLCLDTTRKLLPQEQAWLEALDADSTLVVLTKCDQPRRLELNRPTHITSSTSGAGLDDLRQLLVQAAADARRGDAVALTAERCYDSLRLAAATLHRCLQLNTHQAGEELIAAELRIALAELGKVVGVVYTDDLLDQIFSRFCIGK